MRLGKTYALFRAEPKHPSLQFNKVHNSAPIYSVRITLAYRALAVVENDHATWFWIGSHADYERLLRHL